MCIKKRDEKGDANIYIDTYEIHVHTVSCVGCLVFYSMKYLQFVVVGCLLIKFRTCVSYTYIISLLIISCGWVSECRDDLRLV